MVAAEAPPTLECHRCGTPHAAGQEYCLECGARLPPAPPGAGGAIGPRTRAEWAWPVLVAAVVAVLAAGAAVAAQVTRDGESESFLVATTATPTSPPLTQTAAPPEPTETAPAAPEAPAETQPPPQAPAPEPERLISWPDGTDGFTVVVASIPEASGRANATAKAREARDAGLRQVGVLLSTRYQSLHPGYFVVFSGVYADRGSAENAVAAARRAGYDAAYARQISS